MEDNLPSDTKTLKKLAKSLAMNYVKSSLKIRKDVEESGNNLNYRSGSNNIFSKSHKHENPYSYVNEVLKELNESEFNEHSERIILVVGAGLSFNAFKKIIVATPAINRIQDEFKIGDKSFSLIIDKEKNPSDSSFQKKYQEEINRLRLYGKEYSSQENANLDFETRLNLLSNFFSPEDIRNKLSEIYSYRYGSSFYYDMISHLFKHRFIDIIINFNFDELLDQAIEDELGKDTFIKIISDGDCKPLKDILIDGRIKQPIYIKPHGTYSHKSSLRFTKNQYEELPFDMKKLLTEVITCTGVDESQSSKNPIIISMGFSLGSVEFDKMLSEIHTENNRKPEFYYFYNTKFETQKQKLEASKFIFNPIKLDSIRLLNDDSIKFFDEDSTEYDNILFTLWNLINDFFKAPFLPDNIDRHLFIRACFQKKSYFNDDFIYSVPSNKGKVNKKEIGGWDDYFESADFFKDRAVIEACMIIAKAGRSVALNTLLNSRAGFYFSKYYFSFAKDEERIGFKEFLKELNFKINEKNNSVSFKLYPQNVSDVFSENVMVKLSPTIQDRIKKLILDENIIQLWENFVNTKTSIISSNFNDNSLTLFDAYDRNQLLNTKLSLKYELWKTLSEESWTKIIIVEDNAERFEIFEKQIQKLLDTNAEIHAIFSYDENFQFYMPIKSPENHYIQLEIDTPKKSKGTRSDQKTLNKLASFEQLMDIKKSLLKNTSTLNKIEKNVKFLPESIHQDHMTLFVKESESFLSIKAIYYRKEAYTNKISPIEITKPRNVLQLLEMLEFYYGSKV